MASFSSMSMGTNNIGPKSAVPPMYLQLLPAVRSGANNLNLANKSLKEIPAEIFELSGTLENLNLKNNKIEQFPEKMTFLPKLIVLHMGLNNLREFPRAISNLFNLEKLHIHDNQIELIPENCIGRLKNLKVLNLNGNKIVSIPSDTGFLENLRLLSVERNLLKTLPNEIAHCTKLEELHASENEISSLPIGFGYLTNLKKCILRKNYLQDLPETFGKLVNLQHLDLAVNDLRIFPTKFHTLNIRELYVESNQLIVERPVRSVQEDEVMSLKELTSRTCLKELSQPVSLLRKTIKHYPALREMLSMASKCNVCGDLFLNTWLECVHFVEIQRSEPPSTSNPPNNTIASARRQNPNQKAPAKTPKALKIPVRALLCSYKCFNSQNEESSKQNKSIKYYGVAFPASKPPSAQSL